ncbi:hypothetical protein DICSQDRAFT_93721, partial [Dichomitus squalens LYAD-421 SS1]
MKEQTCNEGHGERMEPYSIQFLAPLKPSHRYPQEGSIRMPSIQTDLSGSPAIAYAIRAEVGKLSLMAALNGTFTVLVLVAWAALVKQRRTHFYMTTALSLMLALLYVSTTTDFVLSVLLSISALGNIICKGIQSAAKDSDASWQPNRPWYSLCAPVGDWVSLHGRCATNGTLIINILCRDAIICWRVSLLWPGNRIMGSAFVILPWATFALGALVAKESCSGTGLAEKVFTYDVAASVLSLFTNLFATLTVAYKAWYSRRFLCRYLMAGHTSAKLERLFSILIESGMAYTALWILVVIWQVMKTSAYNAEDDSALNGLNIFMNGGLVPMIAIYPAIIAILVALNRSHMDKGFTESRIDRLTVFPTRSTIIVVGEPEGAKHDSSCDRGSEVLHIAHEKVGGWEG